MVEGNSAAANADAIIYNIMAAFYTACSTFMGQNLGAGKQNRVLKSYFVGVTYSFFAGAVLGGALFLFGREFLSLFANDEAVIQAGLQRTQIMSFSYAVSAFMDCTIAACRGIGKSLAPHHYCNNRLLRIPGGVDIYRIRIFSYHSFPVSFVYFFMDCHRSRRDCLLCHQL